MKLTKVEVEAKTTYYECDGVVYKLDEPWIGKSKFYSMGIKGLSLREDAKMSDDYIHADWEQLFKIYKPDENGELVGFGARC